MVAAIVMDQCILLLTGLVFRTRLYDLPLPHILAAEACNEFNAAEL